MNVDPDYKRIISFIIVVIMVASSIIVVTNLHHGPTIIRVASGPLQPTSPVQSIPAYLSNITVDLNISPSNSNVSPSLINANSSGNVPSYQASNLNGAVVELYANPAYPSIAGDSMNPGIYSTNGSLPLTITTVNLTWNAQFKLPKEIYNITSTWENSIGNTSADTSMIMDITYLSNNGNSSSTAMIYFGAVPYNPYSMKSGYQMKISKHPVLSLLPSTLSQQSNISIGNNTIYPGHTNPQNSSALASPDYISGGGTCKTIWGWFAVNAHMFQNVPIPMVYINDSKSLSGVHASASLSIGATGIQTGFALSTQYFNTSSKTEIVGTTPTWTFPNSLMGFAGGEARGNPTYNQDVMLGFKGNMSVIEYRYEEYGLAGADAGKLIATTNKYSVSMEITSMNTNDSQFVSCTLHVANQNLSKYNSSSFINLTLNQRYALAFAILMKNNSLLNSGLGSMEYKGNLTLGFENKGQAIKWDEISKFVPIYSPNCNCNDSINVEFNIALAVAGAALALFAVPYSDQVVIPVILISLLAHGFPINSFFASVIITPQPSGLLYYLTLTNSDLPPTGNLSSVEYFYINAGSIQIGDAIVPLPVAYFILNPYS